MTTRSALILIWRVCFHASSLRSGWRVKSPRHCNRTRNLSYRQDDRAMRLRPIYGCKKIYESREYAHGYFSGNFNRHLFRSILWMCVQNLKLDNRGYPKIRQPLENSTALGYAHAPFSKIFNGLLFGCTPWMFRPNLKSVASPVPAWDNRDWSWCGLRTPNLGEEEAVGDRGWYRSKERWWVPIGPP